MGLGRNWTAEEEEYLCENWGKVSLPSICKKLNRSKNAIKVRVTRLGLGAFCDAGDYVTLHQLLKAVTGTSASDTYKIKSWIENRGLPVFTKTISQKRVRCIRIEDFWTWADKNRSFLDFTKMEPLALGKEPEWVAEQRKYDTYGNALQRKDPWTSENDSRLKMLLSQQKYTYAEMSEMLKRSTGAIQRRCTDLGIKERPVRIDPHGRDSFWTSADYATVADGIRSGMSYTMIGRLIGKSEKALRGKIYTVYLTENADKVRAMMGDGQWGTGKPVPTVRQAMTLSYVRTGTKKDISALAGLLKYRMGQLGYDPYWQRHMCMHWDDYDHCRAGEQNCDECISFARIKPQYCARCGGTFFERQENRFCKACRTARKKQAQRHWKREKEIHHGG